MYVNTLISLQESGTTYGIDGQKVSGHVTLSSPGVIRCYVQNLKPQPSNQNLTVCMFSKSRQKGVKIGELGTGKETRWLVDERNIEGSGLKLDEIDAVAIVAEQTMRGTEAILVGYSQERYMIMSMMDSLFPKKPLASAHSIPDKPTQQAVSASKVTKPEVPKAKEPEPIISKAKELEPVISKAKELEPVISKAKEPKSELLQAKKPEIKVSQANEDIILPKDAVSHKIAALYEAVKAADNEINQQTTTIDRAKASENVVKPQVLSVGTNNDTLESELKRIIEEISHDRVLKEKALSIEEQISKISDRPEIHKLTDKSHLEKTLESRYLSKQGEIQTSIGKEEEIIEQEEEEEEEVKEAANTSPKEAIKSFNTLKQKEQTDTSTLENPKEEETTSADQEEINYLEEIDKKLQEIRNRLDTSYQEER